MAQDGANAEALAKQQYGAARKVAATAKIKLDWKEKLTKIVTEGNFEAELSAAWAYTQSILDALPAEGNRSPVREAKDIRDKATAGKIIHSGGSLGMLSLAVPAHRFVQIHKIEHVLQEKWTGLPDSIGDILGGTILINCDMWLGGDELKNLSRASHDAEPWP
jgi:hypothetical protein